MSKSCASFYLPLSVKRAAESGNYLPFWRQSGKKMATQLPEWPLVVETD